LVVVVKGMVVMGGKLRETKRANDMAGHFYRSMGREANAGDYSKP